MEIIILIVNLLLLAIVCFLSIKIIALLKNNQQGDNNQDLQASEKRLKEELAQLRQDIYAINNDFGNKLLQQIISLNNINEQKIENLRQTMDQKLTEMNSANSENIHQLRSALDNRLIQMNEQNNQNLSRIRSTLDERIGQIQESNAQKMDALRDTVDTKLSQMQDNNEKRLESMRETVDEKLHATLEKRLGESFNQVSERLEQVHKGLGEMQNLASGVGDLKKVLANVRNRGTWGEVQLGNLLEDMLSPQQYETNVATNPMAPNNRVEYAVKLPGKEEGHPVYLPIDAKYPLEDYQLLLDAQEKGDLPLMETASKALETRIKSFAKDVRDKYLQPPYTTDFAIIFVPLEGLYAELLRRSGLQEMLQRDYRIVLAGPVTLSALLNSLQMGFRTLAIEKSADEVWQLLSAVKTGFADFSNLLGKTQKKLQEASNSIDNAARKSRTIQRKLKTVGELPPEEAKPLLGWDGEAKEDEEETETESK